MDTIERQYRKRELLFDDPRMLPAFTLKTVRAVQSIADSDVPFANWFDALDSMKSDIAAIDFDIALIGAGAYGLPLAAFIKALGKKVVQTGGATQILFGIKGGRWDTQPGVSRLFNEHWCRPAPSEIPPRHREVEDGCYW